jgi:hypothetical protein
VNIVYTAQNDAWRSHSTGGSVSVVDSFIPRVSPSATDPQPDCCWKGKGDPTPGFT